MSEECPDFPPGTTLRHYVDGSHSIEPVVCSMMPDTPDRRTEMTTQLPFPTTDAMEWVKAFRETFPDANVDDGTMLGWFANAIEHGRGPDPVIPEP